MGFNSGFKGLNNIFEFGCDPQSKNTASPLRRRSCSLCLMEQSFFVEYANSLRG